MSALDGRVGRRAKRPAHEPEHTYGLARLVIKDFSLTEFIEPDADLWTAELRAEVENTSKGE